MEDDWSMFKNEVGTGCWFFFIWRNIYTMGIGYNDWGYMVIGNIGIKHIS
ncbi:hypothetical protein [Candidatus Hodgkinia cicadicola]